MAFERELARVRELAWEAGALALRYQSEGFTTEDKPDDSPVTIADTESERLLVAAFTESFPGDGLLGEEGTDRPGTSGRRWIIDPIDGTRDFVRGNRLWCNLLALEVDGVVEVGVVTFPALQTQYWAVRGEGAWRWGSGAVNHLKCSTIETPDRAVVCFNQLNKSLHRPLAEKTLPFLSRFWAVRALGGALDAMLVATGSAEVWIEPYCQAWDLAPISLIAKEAGCRYFDYTGADSIYNQNAVICTPNLESCVRDYLGLA
ncbi:MAG TPA: inositol monophosphatase family protein [Paludibaculum sp.]|jgi:fructose-1,6-bisphosphatase/inositol monophosphatase family enzyme